MTNSGDQVTGSIDWGNDEAVVRAAFAANPSTSARKLERGVFGRPSDSEYQVGFYTKGRTEWTCLGAGGNAWGNARKIQIIVQSFEARAKGEPCKHEWVGDPDTATHCDLCGVFAPDDPAFYVSEPASQPAVQGEPQEEEPLPVESERRVQKLINYFAGDWRNVPMDDVRRFVRNEFLDERDSVASLPPEAPQQAHATICESCGGDGTVGVAEDSRLISCEACGGHEDSLGLGYIVTKATVPEAPEGAKVTWAVEDRMYSRHWVRFFTSDEERLADEVVKRHLAQTDTDFSVQKIRITTSEEVISVREAGK